MISIWPKAKLSEVAPSKPLKVKNTDAKVWQLNLNHIESNTGRLIYADIQPYSEAGTSTHWFDERHVLYSKLRPYLNKVLLPDQKGLATTELVPMLPNKELLNRKYLAFYLRSKQFVDWVSAQTAGAKMPRVSMKVFWDHEIPLPPLAEQQKIVAILDAADQLRQKDQQLVEHYTALGQSLFLEMFGDPASNPKGWEVRSLESSCYKITDGTHQSPTFLSEGVPFLLVSNIVDNEVIYRTNKFISEGEYNKLTKNTPIEKGDILYTSVGSYGNPAIVKSDEKFCFQRHIAHIKVNHKVMDVNFLNGLLQTDHLKRQADRLARGVAQKTLNLKAIKSFSVICPPIDLQSQFAGRIKSIQNQKKQAQVSLEKSEALFNSLLQRVFKGELT